MDGNRVGGWGIQLYLEMLKHHSDERETECEAI